MFFILFSEPRLGAESHEWIKWRNKYTRENTGSILLRHFQSMKVHHAMGIVLFAFVLCIYFICVYMCLCVCLHTFTHVCICACMWREVRGLPQLSFSIALNLIFWKESLTELGTWSTLIWQDRKVNLNISMLLSQPWCNSHMQLCLTFILILGIWTQVHFIN